MSQHMEALARANEIRIDRANFKRELKAGEVSLATVLRDPGLPAFLKTASVESLLAAIPRLPIKVAQRMLHEVPIGLAATAGTLTYRQRRVLADELTEWEAQRAKRAAKDRRRRARSGETSSPTGAIRAESLG